MAEGLKKRQQSWRRKTWRARVTLWAVLIVLAAGAIAFLGLNRDGSDEAASPTSRFKAIHRFDTADYHSLAFDPSDADTVLFGHHGGLQRSSDGGRTWERMMDQEGWDAMNVAFDPFNPDTIYVAGHNVFFRSDDGGATWQEMVSNLPSLDLHTFAASPNKQGRLYAVPAGYGLYVSEDGGRQWQLVWDEAPAGSNSILELPDGALLLGATDQGILRSEDGGRIWSQSRTGIDLGAIYQVRGDPEGSRIYAATDHGVYVSVNGGRTWSVTGLDDTWVVAVGVSPQNPDTVLAVNRNGQLYRSLDGGVAWG